MTTRRICLGKIGKAHGIQGHVRVKPFTEEPAALANYGDLYDEKALRQFKISSLRVVKGGMLVVKFSGIETRSQADALNGIKLFIDRNQLPSLEEDDDFYVEDLISLEAINLTGEPMGQLVNVLNFGAGDLVEIRPEKGPTLLIPFTKQAVPHIDFAAGQVTVDPQAAGLAPDEKSNEHGN